MKAIKVSWPGSRSNLKIVEADTPCPGDDEVLVKVMASSVNFADAFMVRVTGLGLSKSKIPGSDMAGRVEAVGKNATQFQPGDEVYGDLAAGNLGSYAEYVCTATRFIARKPRNITFGEAAAVPMAGITALQGLRDLGRIQPGSKVLIQGASGGIGTFAVQIAKTYGAEVTGVCSTKNLELVRSLGADYVIDYTREDFTKKDLKYDLILGIKGYHSLSSYKNVLTPQGVYVMAGGSWGQIFQGAALGRRYSEEGGRTLTFLSAKMNTQDLEFLRELIESGKVKPVIDRVYPLGQLGEALGYLGKNHARGKVVIQIE